MSLAATTKYSEAELVMSIKARSTTAFAYLYDNYAGALNGVIANLVSDDVLAEDILQECFLKIWNNFEQYDPAKGRLFTWMLNIARNLAIDTMRSKGYKKQKQISGDENSVSTYADSRYGKERFDSLGVKNYLGKLKPAQRDVIDLAYFSGYTQEEIAEELGIPLGTVKTRARAALLELRKLLQNE
jgi:RNA polymerase sigma factor (sigma-70 family)